MKMKNLLIPAFIAVTAMASANELNLSNFITNTKFSGDARVRYQADSEEETDKIDARLRLNLNTKINDNFSFGARVRLAERKLGAGTSREAVQTERLFMNYKTGNHNLTVGRMGTPIHILSNMIIDTNVDGIAYSTKIQDTQIKAGYLMLKRTEDKIADSNNMFYAQGVHTMNLGDNKLDLEASVYLEQEGTELTVFTLGAQYTMNLGEGQALEMTRLRAQLIMSDEDDDNMGYTAGVLFGSKSLNKKGAWQGEIEYKVLEAAAFIGATDLESKLDQQIIKLGALAYIAPNTNLEVTYEMIEKESTGDTMNNILSVILNHSF